MIVLSNFSGSNGSWLFYDFLLRKLNTMKLCYSSCLTDSPSSCVAYVLGKYHRNILFGQIRHIVGWCLVENFPWYGRLSSSSCTRYLDLWGSVLIVIFVWFPAALQCDCREGVLDSHRPSQPADISWVLLHMIWMCPELYVFESSTKFLQETIELIIFYQDYILIVSIGPSIAFHSLEKFLWVSEQLFSTFFSPDALHLVFWRRIRTVT